MEMFKNTQQKFVEFPSSWSKQRKSENASCQTHDIENKDIACQSVKMKSTKVQTEREDNENVVLLNDNSVELLEFLRRVEPLVTQALDRNHSSHAFDDYRPHSEDDIASVSVIHTLHHAQLGATMHVTGVSWNCIGSAVAVSILELSDTFNVFTGHLTLDFDPRCGRFDHEDWCTHRSCVAVWNIDRASLKADKPDAVIDQSSCVMCLAYHPTQPAILAAANFNGEVVVWDMRETDDLLIATSGIGDDSHREPVTTIEWIPDTDTRKYHLMSVSGDGKVLIWSLRVKDKSLKLIRGFMTMNESLPLSLKSRATRADKEVGVTCVSYNPDDPDTFIVGSESGAIFKCSQRTQGTPAPSTVVCSVPLHSPVTFTFAPHHAPVYAVHLSPFHRNVFLSCALDQTIRIYNLLQAQPVVVIEPGHGYIYAGQWSPSRPTVIVATTESGHLLVYDLTDGRTTPAQILEISVKSSPLYSLQFNKKRPDLLAVGDGLGHVHIVRLGDELVNGHLSRDLHNLDTLTSVKVE